MLRTLILAALAVLLPGCVRAPERCVDAGGSWFTSARRPGAGGVCIMSARDGGKPCRSGAECSSGLCECADNPFAGGAHAVPDGAEGAGVCATFPARSGAGWMCTVEKGRVMRHGIIVD